MFLPLMAGRTDAEKLQFMINMMISRLLLQLPFKGAHGAFDIDFSDFPAPGAYQIIMMEPMLNQNKISGTLMQSQPAHYAVLFQLHEEAVNRGRVTLAGQAARCAEFRDGHGTTMFGHLRNQQFQRGATPQASPTEPLHDTSHQGLNICYFHALPNLGGNRSGCAMANDWIKTCRIKTLHNPCFSRTIPPCSAIPPSLWEFPAATTFQHLSFSALMKIHTTLFFLSLTLSSLHAQDLPRANALEEDAVRALVGKKSTITGKVTDTFESPKGMTFLNLEGGKFTLVAYKEAYPNFEGGSPAKLYKGKTIEVTGEVFIYRAKGASKEDPGKLEIKLRSPDQIKVSPKAETAPEAPAADTPEKKADKSDKDRKDTKDEKSGKPGAGKKPPTKEGPADPKATPAPGEKPGRVDAKKYFK